MSKLRQDWGAVLHFAGGFGLEALALAAWGILGVLALPVVGGFGFAREWWQHRDDPPGKRWNDHRLLEAVAWGMGALSAFGLFALAL